MKGRSWSPDHGSYRIGTVYPLLGRPILYQFQFRREIVMAYGKSKRGGFMGNLAKLGGKSRKLSLAGDMRPENMSPGFKKAGKQAHKKV